MNVKNCYKPSKLEYLPYVYFLKHIKTGIWYVGSKYGKNAHPSTFLKKYFTSSTLMQELLAESTESDFKVKILKTFGSAEETLSYERRVLVRTNAVNNKFSANKDYNQDPSKLLHVKYKIRKISNPNTNKCINVKLHTPLPEGWIEGNINSKGKRYSKDRTWYYDPTTLEAFHLPKNQTPNINWILGRGEDYKSNSEAIKKKESKWVTNGSINLLVNKCDEIPDGYKFGRTKSEIEKSSNFAANSARTGLKYYTDGIVYKQFKLGEAPIGWVLGKTPSKDKRKKIKITNGISDSYVYDLAEIPDGYTIGGKPVGPRQKINFKYTNGIVEIMTSIDKIPDGFIPIAEFRAKNKHLGPHLFPKTPRITITNGVVEKVIPFHHEIPVGFVRGHKFNKNKETK